MDLGRDLTLYIVDSSWEPASELVFEYVLEYFLFLQGPNKILELLCIS